MPNTTIHMNDAGVIFLFNVVDENGVVNLTTVQRVNVYFKRPDNSIISVVGEVINPPQGVVRYVSSESDFNQAGRWESQVVVRFADDNIKHSDIGLINVEDNI